MCKTFPRNTGEQRGSSVGEVFAMQGEDLCSDFQHPYKKAQCSSICGNASVRRQKSNSLGPASQPASLEQVTSFGFSEESLLKQ